VEPGAWAPRLGVHAVCGAGARDAMRALAAPVPPPAAPTAHDTSHPPSVTIPNRCHIIAFATLLAPLCAASASEPAAHTDAPFGHR
jgi:hypothetical protein